MAETSVAATVKNPWLSQINWAQVIGGLASVGVALGAALPPADIAKIIAGIQSAVAVFTIIRNTWFSPSVLEPSAEGLSVVEPLK